MSSSSLFLLLFRRSLAAEFVSHLLAGVVALFLVLEVARAKEQPAASSKPVAVAAPISPGTYATLGTLASH